MTTHRMTGLQIHPRCVKCDRENSADRVLYELRNHAYICDKCYNEEIQTNHRTPQLIEDMPQTAMAQPLGRPTRVLNNTSSATTQQLKPSRAPKRQTTSLRLPPDSMYAMLGLSLAATTAELQKEIEQKMGFWMRAADSQEKDRWIDRLQDWQDIIDNPDRFEEYREQMHQAATMQQGNRALSVGGRPVSTIEEFLAACEATSDGWADGERYLRNGRLKEWVRYQINRERTLIEAISYYQAASLPNFRCLNEVLYCLVPRRPFRLYRKMEWQPLTETPSAPTPEILAQLCDQHWRLAEEHLYNGSMVYWLEHCHGVQGLRDYYQQTVIGYERAGIERGVGLELLLERAIPRLLKPQLVVSFDGTENAYMLDKWDREFMHAPITMRIENKTRGFVSLTFELSQPLPMEQSWIAFDSPPPAYFPGSPPTTSRVPQSIKLYMRPGDKQSRVITRSIMLGNLEFLERGHKYSRTITMKMHGEQGTWQTAKTFPIKIKMMNGFQGMYGKLWLWGMRGNLPGFFWNALAGIVLAYIPFLLQFIVANQTLYTYPNDPNSLNVGQVLQAIVVGTLQLLRAGHISLLQYPLLIGIITGITGFFASYNKGHVHISASQNHSSYKKGVSWLSFLISCTFFFIIGVNSGMVTPTSYGAYYALEFYGGLCMIFLLTLMLTLLVGRIRFSYEQHLRKWYDAFLHPVGRV